MLKYIWFLVGITESHLSLLRCAVVTSLPVLYTVNILGILSSRVRMHLIWLLQDVATATLLLCLSGHQNEITRARILDDSANLIASSSKDGTVKIWDLRSGIQIARQYDHSGDGVEVNCFWSNPDKLVTGLSNGQIAYWDPRYPTPWIPPAEIAFDTHRNSDKPVSIFSVPKGQKQFEMSIPQLIIELNVPFDGIRYYKCADYQGQQTGLSYMGYWLAVLLDALSTVKSCCNLSPLWAGCIFIEIIYSSRNMLLVSLLRIKVSSE